MDSTRGMIAVVQGLRDSGLTVTLLDGEKQYTLMPEAAPHPQSPQMHSQSVNNAAGRRLFNTQGHSGAELIRRPQRENYVQATDGRYASTYKMMHCNVKPTSPPQNVTEFPPQRREVLHGHGNFIVGGTGSGETFGQVTRTNSFRGGMCWPDRGSVCMSRPSVQPDAFANSLRKYPSISPDRSTEIVERLINFTQAKNMSKNQRSPASPTRNSLNSESSKQTYQIERNSSKNFDTKSNQPDITMNNKRNKIKDSSLYRDTHRNVIDEYSHDTWNRQVFCDNDVRCVRDGRNVVEGFRNPAADSNNSVNMEIQASVQMESKEILTLPRIVPMQGTVATQLSPEPSTEIVLEEGFNYTDNTPISIGRSFSCKSIQVKMSLDADIKSSLSTVELRKSPHKSNRQISSKEKLRKIRDKIKVPDEVIKLLQTSTKNAEYETIAEEHQQKSKKKTNCRDLLNNAGSLKICASDNRCACEDLHVKMLHQDISEQLTDFATKCIYIRSNDFRKGTYRDRILQEFMNKLKYLASNTSSVNSSAINKNKKPKKGIHEMDDHHNAYNDILHNTFVKRKRWHKAERRLSNNNNCRKEYETETINSNESLGTTQEEIKNLIDLDILAFIEKYRLNISTDNLCDLRDELFDLLLTELFSVSPLNKIDIKKNIKNVLQNIGFTEYHGTRLTDILMDHWEEEFFSINNKRSEPSNIAPDTFFILPNITQNQSSYLQTNTANGYSNTNIDKLSNKDVDSNADEYVQKIIYEINEWLSYLDLSQIRDDKQRQSVINELANDIVDRHKYLELNPSIEISDVSELEYLKYQIFKFFKLLGDVDMTPVEHANDLMKRIQSVPVPNFTAQSRKLSNGKQFDDTEKFTPAKVCEPSNSGASSSRQLHDEYSCCKKPTCKHNSKNNASSKTILNNDYSLNKSDFNHQKINRTRTMSGFKEVSSKTEDNVDPYYSSSRCPGGIKIKDSVDNATVHDSTPQNKITEEFTRYLKEWTEDIPIPLNNREEEIQANTARKTIYNDLWDSISRLILKSGISNDQFLCEDILDDKIEILLGNLPQTSELKLKKHALKVKIIVKAIDTMELLKALPARHYKHELIESIKRNLPVSIEVDTHNPDVLELYEDLQILNIVEDFIIFSRYQNEDEIISEAYRKNLIQCTEAFIAELKANHGEALIKIDSKLYLDNIIDALKKVPLPTDETLRDETDEILLRIEIEKWFSELPIIENNDFLEQLYNRYLKNVLAKQIHNIEKDTHAHDATLNNNLKQEISKFLERIPLQRGNSLDTNLMVDGLIERLRNRSNAIGNGKKKIGFHETCYDDFSRNMQFCSSFTASPKAPSDNELKNQRMKILSDRSIQSVSPNVKCENLKCGHHNIAKPLPSDIKQNSVKDQTYDTYEEPRPLSSTGKSGSEPHWYTLQESNADYAKPNTSCIKPSTNFDPSHIHNKPYYPNNEEFLNGVKQYGTSNRFVENGHEYTVHRKPSISLPSSPKRESTNRTALPTQSNDRNTRRTSDEITDQRYPESYLPLDINPRRRDSVRFNRDMRSDVNSSRKPPQFHNGLINDIPNQSRLQNFSDEGVPLTNRSLFYRSTDKEGIRQTIEHNKGMEPHLNSSSHPEFLQAYYPPVMTPGYMPCKLRYKKVVPEERFREDSEEDDEDETRCRCVERIWKNRQHRYCPYDDSYPMCMSTPYFYPYFY